MLKLTFENVKLLAVSLFVILLSVFMVCFVSSAVFADQATQVTRVQPEIIYQHQLQPQIIHMETIQLQIIQPTPIMISSINLQSIHGTLISPRQPNSTQIYPTVIIPTLIGSNVTPQMLANLSFDDLHIANPDDSSCALDTSEQAKKDFARFGMEPGRLVSPLEQELALTTTLVGNAVASHNANAHSSPAIAASFSFPHN